MSPIHIPSPGDRTLFIIDIENLSKDAMPTNDVAIASLNRCLRTCGWREGDQIVVAAHRMLARRLVFDVAQSCRFLIGHPGPDGSDRRLIEEVESSWAATRFGRVVIGSGDHAFCPLVTELRALGCIVEIHAAHGSRSRALDKALAAAA